jgi:hypothetical protein
MRRFKSMCTNLIPLLVGLGVPLLPFGDSRSALGSPAPEPGSRSQAEAIQNKPMVPDCPPRCVGQIRVVGNEATRDGIILDQLELCPGARFSRKDLQKAQRRLARLGLFDAASVCARADLSDSPFKTIIVVLQERPDANLRLTLAQFLCYLQESQVERLTAAHIAEANRLLDRCFLLLQYLSRLCSTAPQSTSSP